MNRNYAQKILLAIVVGWVAAPLIGCPSGSNQQQIALAAENASIAVQGFQQVEIAAHQAGSISNEDHQFIQEELIAVGAAGKAADSCIQIATSKQGVINCVNTAISTIDQINSAGALHIKSVDAKQKYQIALTGVRTALAVIITIEGGSTPPAAPGGQQ